jgi:hypothetical protein
MTAYYVATLARYVVVDAENESQARELRRRRSARAVRRPASPLRLARCRSRSVSCVPRPADEIEMVRFHERMLASERRLPQQPLRPVRIGDRIRLVVDA